jgi:hypothetical protein
VRRDNAQGPGRLAEGSTTEWAIQAHRHAVCQLSTIEDAVQRCLKGGAAWTLSVRGAGKEDSIETKNSDLIGSLDKAFIAVKRAPSIICGGANVR